MWWVPPDRATGASRSVRWRCSLRTATIKSKNAETRNCSGYFCLTAMSFDIIYFNSFSAARLNQRRLPSISGTVNTTRQPAPGWLDTSHVPPISAMRCAMFVRPLRSPPACATSKPRPLSSTRRTVFSRGDKSAETIPPPANVSPRCLTPPSPRGKDSATPWTKSENT